MNRMKNMFAGLIALVAGVALSAGSAFATNGYRGGDLARMKLIPYYETGDMKATIIGIQNTSQQEVATRNANNKVAALKVFLDGKPLSADTVATGAGQAALDAINLERGGTTALEFTGTPASITLMASQLELKAHAEAALEKAEAATYTEHVYVTVNVFDKMGMMMDDGSATLCLAKDQFGHVTLQGASADMMMPTNQSAVLSVMDGDIAAYGYVEISAADEKFTGCGGSGPVKSVDTADIPVATGITTGGAASDIATWAIIQDTSPMGFFGTEVPSATISKARNSGPGGDPFTNPADDGDPELACYDNEATPGTPNPAAANTTPHTTGTFDTTRCGLIPERHRRLLNADGTLDTEGDDTAINSSTPNTSATARYDIGDETMIYVWLGKGMDAADAKPTARRMLDVVVKCEDGTVQMAPDRDNVLNQPIKVPAPGMLTMIDPMSMEKDMGEIGMYTDKCDGERGVLQITMPTGSHAGMVFTHISQMMGHYRMNFPGYSWANPMEIDAPAN